MTESIKILILGVIVYVSSRLFFRLGARWFPELRPPGQFQDRVATLRKRFWRSFFVVVGTTAVVLVMQYVSGSFPNAARNWLRVAAANVALVATLGRGGWAIQSFNGQTIVERIDRGMFVLSQVGATILLLFALGL